MLTSDRVAGESIASLHCESIHKPGRQCHGLGERSPVGHLLKEVRCSSSRSNDNPTRPSAKRSPRAFEFSATIAIFCLIGFGLDRWFDTAPFFMVTLFVIVLIGQTVRLWYAYDAQMRKHEAERRQAIGGERTS